jgi:TonB family protein
MTEIWKKWEGQVIGHTFPLRRFLGSSDHSGVFLTEHQATNLPNAAIKIVAADPVRAEAQLWHWKMAASLSHPHLIKLFDAGRCQLGPDQFLYVVMEYAEQTLSEILPHRALTADEVREMLHPILDALAFLHGEKLVQGRLKPPNILVVNDQVKLASDSIRLAGESASSMLQPSSYDPPELNGGSLSAAGDVWALGITMIEALTQSATASLPASVPPAFADLVRACLNRNPAERPKVSQLEAQIGPERPERPEPQVPVYSIPQPAPAPRQSPKRRLTPVMVAPLVMVLLAVWAGSRLFHSNTTRPQTISSPAIAKSTEPEPSPSPPAPAPSDRPAQPPANSPNSPNSVLHAEIPSVPPSALNTIHGHVVVAVRVTVDSSGNVVDETLQDSGPSKYFARLASAAASKWKFAPADTHDPRQQLLSFEFTRDGATANATTPP